MAYVVDRVVICDAFREPDRHYQLLPGGRSKLVERPPAVDALPRLGEGREGRHRRRRRQGGAALRRPARPQPPSSRTSSSTSSATRCARGARPATRARRWSRGGCSSGGSSATRSAGRSRKRFFFCQQEAVETVIYLYEVQSRRKMPETGDLLRYALKLATGTGKTVVMALFVTWATLHKRKVSGSSLSANFLVLVPNLTVRDRVSGHAARRRARPGRRAQPLRRLRHGAAGVPGGVPPERAGAQLAGHPARERSARTGSARARCRSRRGGSSRRRCCARCSGARSRTRTRRSGGCSAAGATSWSSTTRRTTSTARSATKKGEDPELHQVEQDPRAHLEGGAAEPGGRPLGDALVRLGLAQARGDALRVAGVATSRSTTPSSPGWSRWCGCPTRTSRGACTSTSGTW